MDRSGLTGNYRCTDALSINPRQLMRLHLQALYTFDEVDRLIATNVPAAGPPPRFFLGRTSAGPVAATSREVPERIAEQLAELAHNVPAGVDEHTPVPLIEAVSALLHAHRPVAKVWAGPNYHCPPAPTPSSGVVTVTPSNASVLTPHLDAWLEDVSETVPMAAVLRHGRAVSVCCSVRISAEADEAGVETHPNFRGHGFGTLAVAAWSKAVGEGGRLPLYSTSWENKASQRVATKLGLAPYGTVLHVT